MKKLLLFIMMSLPLTAVAGNAEMLFAEIITANISDEFKGKHCTITFILKQRKDYLFVRKISTIGHKGFCAVLKKEAQKTKKLHLSFDADNIELKSLSLRFRHY